MLHLATSLDELADLKGNAGLADIPDEDETVLVAASHKKTVAVPGQGRDAALVAGDFGSLILKFGRIVHARVVVAQRALLVADGQGRPVKDHRARALHLPLDRRPLRREVPELHVAAGGG